MDASPENPPLKGESLAEEKSVSSDGLMNADKEKIFY